MDVICLPVGGLETNCYIVYDENKIGAVIDPGGDAPRILNSIKKNGLQIQHILLTHVHFDHVLAAEEIIKATGADFLVPQDDEGALTNSSRSLMRFFDNSNKSLPKADRVFSGGEQIKAGNLNFRVLHTPGHTPGSSCFICGDTLFSGDTLFAGGIGRTDFPGGNAAALNHSLELLSALEGDYTVRPGHGPRSTLSLEKQQNPYMQGNFYDITD